MSAKDLDSLLGKMDGELVGWNEPEEHLHQALANDELTLFCQLIAALTGPIRFPMAEVLIRLRQEEEALLPPGEFLPVFEHYRLMPDLDRWVVRKVLQHLARGSRIPRFTVNVSSQTLDDPGFPKAVALELVSTGVPGTALLFEINEADMLARRGLRVFCGQHPRCGLRPDGFRLRSARRYVHAAQNAAARLRQGRRRHRAQTPHRAHRRSEIEGHPARRQSHGLPSHC
ncbi:MAG: EAL domain-containing protein [Betaproteobacteria bacterium]|nr:EAL domain-containing protein [Betaproteobacteria bacterium]MSQ88401.1 EAL domain-containing protein [Betaproteobacteria bacterium]